MLGQIVNYINPFSTSYHACETFKELSGKQKIIAIALTTLAAIFSLGLGTAAAFRALVGRFKIIEKDHTSETQTTHGLARKIFSPEITPPSEEESSQSISSLQTSESKKADSQNVVLKPLDNPVEDVDESHDYSDYEGFDHYLDSDGEEYDEYLDDDYSYDEGMDEKNIEEAPVKITTQPVKHVSKRTLLCREKLNHILAEQDQKIVETPDNGDCFYAAFAAGISHHLGKEVSLQEIRRIVSDELKELHTKNPDNWVKAAFEGRVGEIDTYESYLNYIHEDAETALKNKRMPIWGKEAIDGVLLCRHYGVNLSVTEIIPMTELPETVEDLAYGDMSYPNNEAFDATIQIAIYPGHFLGVLPSRG